METVAGNFLESGIEMGNVTGPVCIRMEHAVREFCQLVSPARGLTDERNGLQMDRPESVRIPPICSDKRLFVQVASGTGGDSANLPAVAEPTLVPAPLRTGSRDSVHLVSEPRAPSLSGGATASSSGIRIDHTNRLEVVRSDHTDKGFSPGVVDLLMAGIRPTTQSAYQSAWSAWCNWCVQRSADPLSASVNKALEFLFHLFSLGRAYSTINVARSMLSSTFPPVEGNPIGQHHLILKLMKGIYNSKPPKPRYESTWSIDLITNYYINLAPNAELSLSALSEKLAVLLALTSMLRVSELASIDRLSVVVSEEKVSFALSKPRKAQKSGPLHNISINSFIANPKLCPVACVGFYVYLTDHLRNEGNSHRLFISTVRPHKPVTGSSLGRWIKTALGRAGVDTSVFKAHSARGAAASKAVGAGIPVDTVLKTAHWSVESTFTKFYYREVVSENIAEAVLNVSDI